MKLSDYQNRSKFVDLSRDKGILLVRLHSKNQSMVWSTRTHDELGEVFSCIATDRENRVVILTGTGESFIGERFQPKDPGLLKERDRMDAYKWEHIYTSGLRLIRSLLDINVPVIAAVNGPALVHAELPVMCDIVIASTTAEFQDGHFDRGIVPGDGCHVIWPMLLGPNRGRHFLLMAQKLSAEEALRLGVVTEVHAPERLMPRAMELAASIAARPELVTRYTRALFAQPFKRALADDLVLGLSLEGLAQSDRFAPVS